MTTPFRLRLGLLVGAIVLFAGATFWAVLHSWQQISHLEHRMNASQFRSFTMADGFQHRLLNLNNTMLRFVAGRDTNDWNSFEHDSALLAEWMGNLLPTEGKNMRSVTPQEREILSRLEAVYGLYLEAAREVRTNRQPALVAAQGFGQLSDFERHGEHLLELSLDLAQEHRLAEKAFITAANRSLRHFRTFLIASVALMLGLVAALGVLIYREQIAPLRTRLVESQALMEKQEKLATLGTLAAGIAHEIRNPLTSVKARLYNLDKHLSAPDLARKDAEIIGAEIARLERIVKEVLSFARPSEPKLEVVDVPRFLQELQTFMSGGVPAGVRVVVECDAEVRILADAAHMKQVMINLIRNAAEAIPGEGVVTLRGRAGGEPLPGHSGRVVTLEVADNGRGIAPDIEKRLFDPFFSTKDTGTGLGLSIAARIVEKHGGRLHYQTRVGHGTTFGVVLPEALPDTETRASKQHSQT